MPPFDLITDPVIVVHSLGHAVAALKAAAAAGRRVTLASAPGAGGYAGAGWFRGHSIASGAGGYAGAGWFRGLVEAAREAVPEAPFSCLLDCGDEAGAVLAALRS